MMLQVPKILWQSYKSIDQLPIESLPCIDSWLRLNPGWKYHFCSDDDAQRFFQVYQSGRYNELYQAMPLAVMKADLWRYAILEQFGGFYADIDTYCLAPVDDWLNPKDGFHVACEADYSYFCQWAFGGAPHHPVLRTILEMIRDLVEKDGGVDETIPHYVHRYTGPAVWTEAIRQYLGADGPPCRLEGNRPLQRNRQMRLYPSGYFGGIKIHHVSGSTAWCDIPGYESWQRQRKDLANRIV